jgi:catechol 2,3-dioxygenase-like lactoylglutathione lyase family enzyme
MTIKKVTHTTVYVNDQDAALAFYRDKLGFKVHTDADMEGMRWLTLSLPEQPDFELVLMKPSTPESQALVGKQTPESPLLCVETDDCKGTYEKLKAQGVTFADEPKVEPWGTSALAFDLYGNGIYIVQPAQY